MNERAQSSGGDGISSSTNGNSSPPATSITEIEKLNNDLIKVTKHHPICIGAVYKVDSQSYPNWGFEATKENMAELMRTAGCYYRKDYSERRRNGSIEQMLKTDFKVTHERRMAEFIAVTVREMMRSMDDGTRQFHICDIPAREGNLSVAIAHALRRDNETEKILSRTVFHLVDISGHKLDKAEDNLSQFSGTSEKCITEDEVLFKQLDPGTFDIIVTLGHLHHKPFLVQYLTEMNPMLKDDGALVIADWHSPLCTHPAHILSLLQNIGLEPYRLDMFREIMGNQLASGRIQLEDDEANSLNNHIMHWKSIMRKLMESSCRVGESSRRVGPRLYINAAYDTSRQRQKKLADAGFSLDLADIRKAFSKAHLPMFSCTGSNSAIKRLVAGSDSATVMVGVKKG